MKVSLEEAKTDLEETEYDKYISDQGELLDEMYTEYEEILNERLDNIDQLMQDMINEVNNSASVISQTINEAAEKVGYIVSGENQDVWDTGNSESGNSESTSVDSEYYGYNAQRLADLKKAYADAQSASEEEKQKIFELISEDINLSEDAIKDCDRAIEELMDEINRVTIELESGSKNAVGMYGTDGYSSSAASNTVDNVVKEQKDMYSRWDKDASTSVPNAMYSKEASGTTQNNGKVNIGDKVTLMKDTNYFSTATAKKKKGTTNKAYTLYVTATGNKGKSFRLSWKADRTTGDLGWIKNKNKMRGYASGVEKLLQDELAWTQEKGAEFIMRRSDGALLTPLTQGDGVLNAQASSNLWNMANNPADFVRDNLGLGDVDTSVGGSSQNTIINNLEGVTFSLPGVKNYNEFVQAMTKDKNVERYVKSITTDLIAGKSKLAKGKSIR